MRHDLRDVAVGINDFLECDWKHVIASSTREGYTAIWQALSKAADEATDEGRLEKGRCLRLLADAASMVLDPERVSDPFRPILLLPEGRSALPTDFDDSEVRLFAELVGHVDDPWLKARLSDLCWILLRPRQKYFALVAIDAYTQIALDFDNWISGGDGCWKRAISLALLLKQGAGERLNEIEATLLTAFDRAAADENYLALWLAQLLGRNGLGRSDARLIADRLQLMAEARFSHKNFHEAREYLVEAERWLAVSGDLEESVEVITRLAEGWEAEGDANLAREEGSNLVAASFFEKAIQTLRRIPRKHRDQERVTQRMDGLRRKLFSAGEAAVDEMHVVSAEPLDISEMVLAAIDRVEGKSATEALAAFVSLSRGGNADTLLNQAEQTLQRFSLQALFATTHFSGDGRVIAKQPATGPMPSDAESRENAVWAEAMRFYRIQISLIVQGLILPALDTLRLEHRLTARDFVLVAEKSAFVPVERANLLGRGLAAGYDGDFVLATHLLVPQIEHLMRWHLKEAGAATTNLDLNGIETENSLGTLLNLPQAKEVFGRNLVFELQALLCDPLGPNLRNELAHGLLSEEACFSGYTVYFWWLVLKTAFIPFWNSMRLSE